MDRKKLLLVAISVGVFLVIIISASILIFSPKAGAGSGTAFSSGRPIEAGKGGSLPSSSVSAADTGRKPDDFQSQPLANASQETNFYINGEKPDAAFTVEKSDGDVSAKVTINIPKPSAAAVPDAPAAQPAKPAGTGGSAAVSTPAKPAAKPSAAASAHPRSASAKPAPKKSDYWVQTGAFSTLVRAEGVKENLSSKGITSIIENRVVDGKTWYRVRVGPYTSETEANYWLALVRSIDGFADSQVRQTVATR
jgi:DedD protein